jgi:3-oxoacyl-(acyl-carrier-protein) synthase III
MHSTFFADISAYIPARKVGNAEIEDRVNHRKKLLPEGGLMRLFGCETRYYAAANEQTSDLAAQAALPIVEKYGRTNIDFLIFASASSDLLEPATANIVQQKLGLRCPVMDVKNACNSFVSGLQTADAMIQAGFYEQILIVTGERLSSVINFDIEDGAHLRRSLASFSLGDAGTAVLVAKNPAQNKEKSGSGIKKQRFMSLGEHWNLCTVKGGGSMFSHDVSKNFFEGHTKELGVVIRREAAGFLKRFFTESNTPPHAYEHIFTHQVAESTFDLISQEMALPAERISRTFREFGNTAAASIPLSMHKSLKNNALKRGDSVLILGLAAGVSVSVQSMIW